MRNSFVQRRWGTLIFAAFLIGALFLAQRSYQQQPPPPPRTAPAAASVEFTTNRTPDTSPSATRPPVPDPLPPRARRAATEPQPLPGEPQFAAFLDWAQRYEAADAQQRMALVEEGTVLAQQRRSAMFSLIQTDPERALALAVSSRWRDILPAGVTQHLEEFVHGRGDYAVLAVYPLPGQEREVVPIQRSVSIGDRRWRAFVYGPREDYPTKRNVSLHGIALDDVMAVSKDALVVRDPADPSLRAPPMEEAICSISGVAVVVANEPTPVDVGGEITWLCRYDHVEELNQKMLAAAGQPGEGGEGEVAESPYTEGRKRVIMFRVAFPDLPTPDITSNSLVSTHAAVNNFWRTNSYGRTSLAPLEQGSSIVQVNLPNPYASYDDEADALRNDVRAAATAQGISLSAYDFDIVYTGSGRPSFSFGGLGFVGGPGSWVVGASTSISAHELGHNLGFPHANYWDTGGKSANGPGGNQEYGDPYDVMGGGSASGGATGHYVSKFKWRIGWLLEADFPRVTSSGTYRIYAHDQFDARGVRGLRFFREATRDYFLEFRQLLVANASQMNGIGLRWGSPGGSSSQLIDTTPNSPGGKNDAAITIGRTFSDLSAAVHITPLGFGNTYPQSMDVRVNFGNAATNQAPKVLVAAHPQTLAPGGISVLSALATDPNGDSMAYAWDFGDGTFSTNNQPTASKAWSSAGEYLVRCVVSDLKGGTASKSILVRVGASTTFTISGRVLSQGKPLAGVQVRASSSRLAYTDTDGTYTIAGLAAGNYTLSAQLYPLTFLTPFFSNPVAVGPSATNIDFIGVVAPLNDVVLSPTGAVWKYLATAANPGTTWVAPSFNDASWASGRAELGYGDGDEATVVSYGPNANNKYITTYFRRAFTVTNAGGLDNFTLSLRRDDGAIVYLNGSEVLRDNLPSGVVTFSTPAVDNSEDTTVATIDSGLILPGTNVLAVEVHQVTPSSSDMSFEMSLTATTQTNFASLFAFYISSPSTDAVIQHPANVPITVGAFSTAHSYTKVEFFGDGVLLGEDANAPFSYQWNDAPLGAHQLTAVATLSSGVILTSAPVQITLEAPVERTLIAANSSWRYDDGGVSLGSAWRTPEFADQSWSIGSGPFGFGDAGITTLLEPGPSGSRTPTFYFRHTFNLADASLVTNLIVNIARDDGVVVYLNGEEAGRINMSSGSISFTTLATSSVDGVAETTPVPVILPTALLRDGPNVLAVELHQSSATSSDARFDASLIARVAGVAVLGVRLTTPIAGRTIVAPLTERLAATALAGAAETIDRVAFYADDILLGEDSTVPYGFDWTIATAGEIILRALAYESGGTIHTSAPVTVTVQAPPTGEQLISSRALWRYLDNGADPGVAWRQRSFDDAEWGQGYARLGYGGDGELSTVSYGADPSKRHITTYFRRSFVISNLLAVQGLRLLLSRDDGAVVYLNGQEIYRNNLADGLVSFNSLALAPIDGSAEQAFLETRLGATGLVSGTNVIAVEIHQSALSSPDLGFDLALIAEAGPNLTEGVYLTAPAQGARVTLPAAVNLAAFASSEADTVAKVEFRADGITIGEDATAPYEFSWPDGRIGEHSLQAVARLTSGGSVTSAPVAISIDAPPMMVSPVMTTFIYSGSPWRYWNTAAAPAGNWNTREFNDADWLAGNARFGWGLDGEFTTLTSGRITHYFRRSFEVANPALLEDLIFQLQRDDGAVVYVNGVEMLRSNMPPGPPSHTTLALATADGLDEQQFFISMVPAVNLVPGTNVVAVEIHQASPTSSDAGFDLHLSGVGSTAPRLLLSRPSTGQRFTVEAPVEIEAAAWAGQGRTVSKVEYFGNEAKIGETLSEPHIFGWAGLPFGTHTVRARMTDNFGVTIDSDSASFSVGFAVVNTNFISAGANWKFLDNGSNPGASWVQPGYDDQAWASGPAQLGYGDNDEATVVGFGPSSSAKFVTTYFRRTFDKPVDWVITNLTFRLVRDDGAVVWLNGREAYRVNMPGGAIGFNTLASATVDNENEDAFFATTLAITNLNTGANTVAVEIHQRTVGSSDISFDLELSGAGYFTPVEAPEPRIVKMPNGQVGVSWRTTAGWTLVTSPGLGAGATWLPVGIPPSESGGSSTVLINPGEENAFYRLVK